MKLDIPFDPFLRCALIAIVISFAALLTPASLILAGLKSSDSGIGIVGQWRGLHHVRAFYADGSFFIDPEPEGRPVGKWKVRGNLLIILLPGEKIERVEQIIKLTSTEMVVTAGGTRCSYRRITHY
jgi:hypothetical protein